MNNENSVFIIMMLGCILMMWYVNKIEKKKGKKKPVTRSDYLNHPEVKAEIDKYYECIKLLHESCVINEGYMIFAEFPIDDYDVYEPSYKRDYPRIYVFIEFVDTFSLEKYKESLSNHNVNGDLIWSENHILKSVFGENADSFKKTRMLGNLDLENAKYKKDSYKLTMIFYVYAPSGSFSLDDLPRKTREEYFLGKLEQMYKEYKQS